MHHDYVDLWGPAFRSPRVHVSVSKSNEIIVIKKIIFQEKENVGLSVITRNQIKLTCEILWVDSINQLLLGQLRRTV